MEKLKELRKLKIEYLEGAIKNMLEDEATYGLVREDYEQIKRWKGEISVLMQENNQNWNSHLGHYKIIPKLTVAIKSK